MRVIYETLTNAKDQFARVSSPNSAGDFVVRFYDQSGKMRGTGHMPTSDYFTNDRADAISTAVCMVFGNVFPVCRTHKQLEEDDMRMRIALVRHAIMNGITS